MEGVDFVDGGVVVAAALVFAKTRFFGGKFRLPPSPALPVEFELEVDA